MLLRMRGLRKELKKTVFHHLQEPVARTHRSQSDLYRRIDGDERKPCECCSDESSYTSLGSRGFALLRDVVLNCH